MSTYKNPDVIRRIKKGFVARNKAINFEYLCMLPGCSKSAINSHIIQRSQFLHPISDVNQKLMTLETRETFPGKLPKFKKVPIRGILTFKGFCDIHDQMIFAEIEKKPFNLTDNKHLGLFVYRGICHELNKKQIIVKWTEELLKDKDEFSDELLEKTKQELDLQNLGIKDISYFKNLIEKDIVSNESNFEYQVHKLEKREVVTSGCFTIENLIWVDGAKLHDEEWRNKPLKTVAITLFPINDELILILGYLKTDLKEVNSFIQKLGGISLDFVNKILIEYAETWACSENFYNEYINHQLKAVQIACTGTNVHVPAGIVEIPNIMNNIE